MRILFYLLSIVTANVVTAAFAPLQFGMFIVPMGTLFIGATFIFRDLVQNKYGRGKTYLFIYFNCFNHICCGVIHTRGYTIDSVGICTVICCR